MEQNEKPITEPLICDCCKQETDAVFLITILSLGEKEICAKCYLNMLPEPDRTRKF